MAGYNRIIMVGNLTRDPELRQLPSGQSVCRMNIASNRQFKNRQTGSMVQEVCYVDIDVWGSQAESSAQYLKKGRPVLVEGRLKLDSWKDAEGQQRSKHCIVADRVVFLGSANAEAGTESEDGTYAGSDMSSGSVSDVTKARPAVSEKSMGMSHMSGNSDQSVIGGSALFKDEQPFADDLPF